MLKGFLNEKFLLNNDVAVELYDKYAKDMPIFDFHNHIDSKEIAENLCYKNITELWLKSDHYKWRIMRINGIDEKFITGTADDFSKFKKIAETIPKCIGNPIYQWIHLELRRYFGIEKLLSPESAEEIWNVCNKMLQRDEFRPRALLKRANVKFLCTTDDPADSLTHHVEISKDASFDVKVLPTFRADNAIYIEREGFVGWLKKLEGAANIKINCYSDFKDALIKRINFFNETGCRMSDHSLESALKFSESTEENAEETFIKVINGVNLNDDEIAGYRTQVLSFLGKIYNELNWTMQLHVGAVRNTNSRMYGITGPDAGFDTITDYPIAENMIYFLNCLDVTDELPKTIIYCLNPSNNEIISAITGCFQSQTPAKIQFGAAWWFNDQKDGITRQITALAGIGLLSRSVGMLTDSRSMISFTRHEYFRRILCNMLGQMVYEGVAPNDINLIGKMVRDICYNNATQYFGII
jgi:glucuronate isomerase